MMTMRAMAVEQFGSPENLKPATLSVREPAEDEALIRLAAAAVNPADIGVREGRYRWAQPLRLPLVPGYDVAGTIEVGTPGRPAPRSSRPPSTPAPRPAATPSTSRCRRGASRPRRTG